MRKVSKFFFPFRLFPPLSLFLSYVFPLSLFLSFSACLFLSMFIFLSLVVGGFCRFLIGGLRQSSILLLNFANLGYDMVWLWLLAQE